MQDATDYAWVPDGATVTADTLPSLPNLWQAKVSQAEALAAPTGDASTSVAVYANQGRWIVECPVCSDAQLAVRTDPRFMCVSCANAAVGGVWRPVTWPDDHPQIEAVLDVRPDANQNWTPDETLADLEAQNQAAGL